MIIYSMSMAIDKNSKTDCTQFRRVLEDFDAMEDFLIEVRKSGVNSNQSKKLFKKIKFFLDKNGKNPNGDIFSNFVYSKRAGELIKTFDVDFSLFELISIDNIIPAYYIDINYVPIGINFENVKLDIFKAQFPTTKICVSKRFKQAWESAGLLGAEFQAHDAAQLTIDANAKKARLDALMMKKQ